MKLMVVAPLDHFYRDRIIWDALAPVHLFLIMEGIEPVF
jgi:hypothetical protein